MDTGPLPNPYSRAHVLAVYAPRVNNGPPLRDAASTTVALPEERRVLAGLGWAGETVDFFEHSRQLLLSVLFRACVCEMGEIFNTPIV